MNKRNRLLAALLCFLMILSCFSMAVTATKDTTVVTYAVIGERGAYHTQELQNGSTIGSSNYPDDPVREGKKFTGWFYDSAEGRVYVDTSFAPDGDITLLTELVDAPVSYTVTYAVPGEGVYRVCSVVKGASIADGGMPDEPVSFAGCFDSWYYNENGGRVAVTSAFVPASDITLLAQFKSSHEWNCEAATEENDKHCVVCGYVSEERLVHTHSGILTDAKAATCTETGNSAYYVCSCGKWFSDADCTAEISDHNSVITATVAHSGGEATCSSKAVCVVCGLEYGEFNALLHKNKELRGVKTATEADEGYTGDVVCVDCGEIIEKGETVAKLPHIHSVTMFDEIPVSCTANGSIAYWYCEGCGKYFADADGSNEIALSDTVIEQLSHDYSVINNDEDGHWYSCSLCGDAGNADPHTGGEATCIAKAVCEVCGAAYGAVVSDAHGETELRDVVEATCSADGYSGDTYCKDCGVKIASGNAVTVAHKLEKTDAVAPTHTEQGSCAYYKCAVCEKLFSDSEASVEITSDDTLVPALGHEYGAFVSDADGHHKECSCGSITDDGEHTFGGWTIVKEASEDADGSKERKCSVCGYTDVESIQWIAAPSDDTKDDTTAVAEPGSPDTDAAKPGSSDTASEKTETADNASKVPGMGDDINVVLLIGVMLAAVAGVVFVKTRGRKNYEA